MPRKAVDREEQQRKQFQQRFEIVRHGEWYRIAYRLPKLEWLDTSKTPRRFICGANGQPIGYRKFEQAQFIMDRGKF